VGLVPSAAVARFAPARRRGDAGLQLPGSAGAEIALPSVASGVSLSPVFSVGQIGVGAHDWFRGHIARSPGGYAAQPCYGGWRRIASWTSAPETSNKAILIQSLGSML
jgi:hypothetical protein